MNALLVFCHPERASFNGGLLDVAAETLARAGYRVEVSDLYAERFDPVERAGHYLSRADEAYFAPLTEQRKQFDEEALTPQVQREIARLEWADLVVFQFPLWWHAQPAMLKGWFDRVFVYGGIYSGSMRYDRGHFRGKRAICSVTTGSPEKAFMPFGRAGNIVELMWPIHCSLYYVGYEVLPPQVSYGVQGGGISYRDEAAFRSHLDNMKNEWSARLREIGEESGIPFTGWDDWDGEGMLKHNHPARWRP